MYIVHDKMYITLINVITPYENEIELIEFLYKFFACYFSRRAFKEGLIFPLFSLFATIKLSTLEFIQVESPCTKEKIPCINMTVILVSIWQTGAFYDSWVNWIISLQAPGKIIVQNCPLQFRNLKWRKYIA